MAVTSATASITAINLTLARRVAGGAGLRLIRSEPDAITGRIVASWPHNFGTWRLMQ
ncbi:MAG TPA: hypothetical protein VNX29_12365 [Kaistia sp.]|nr:hypothetical protein [Kaistia sp.]